MSLPLTALDLVSRRIFSVSPDDTVAQAAEALHCYRINALPLVSSGEIVGLLSRREIDDALHHGLGAVSARSISAGPPPTVSPEATLTVVDALLRQHRLVVVGTLCSPAGVLTRTAVHRALQEATAPMLWEQVEAHLGSLAGLLAALGDLSARRGESALLIGGCVRDLLRGHTPNDVDVLVVGDAAGLAKAAATALGGRASSNPAFGTAHWVTPDRTELDLASARTEHYTAPGALPTVITPADLRQDLSRRDFTINMMALTLGPGERGRLVDPYSGRADLEAGILRVTHGLSFLDDPTRFFRAARFAARLDLDLEPGTADLMAAALALPVRITRQRIGAELDRIFAEERAVAAMAKLQDWGVLAWIAPELAAPGIISALMATTSAWKSLSETGGVGAAPDEALWLTLACALPQDARERCSELVAGTRGRRARWLSGPGRLAAAAQALSESTARSTQGQALRGLDAAELVVLASGREQAAVTWWLCTGRHIPLTIDGRRLMACGVQPGPRMGAAIAAARGTAWNGGNEDAQIAAAMRVFALSD
ncbi:MAG: CBS domain-containing protein [Myxococcota bacterium]|nr:CBS domain-containing protein [Myxococcota bacterium]